MDAPRDRSQQAGSRRIARAAVPADRRVPLSKIKSAWWPALVLAPLPLFGETVDFNALPVGAPPPGWVLAKPADGEAPRWEITVDASSLRQGRTLAQLSSDRTPERFPIAVYRDTKFADGQIAVRFKPVTGSVAQAAGLVWRYRDRNNYYVVRADALDGDVVAYRVEKGRRTALVPIAAAGEVAEQAASGRWSTLRVAFAGGRFAVSLDGVKVFDLEDATFAGPGQVGLWTEADSVTYFDDFEIDPTR